MTIKKYLNISYNINEKFSKTAVDVFNSKSGDCNEISYLYTSFLRLAGFDAYIVYIPPKYELIYHACVGVYISKKIVLLDITQAKNFYDVKYDNILNTK